MLLSYFHLPKTTQLKVMDGVPELPLVNRKLAVLVVVPPDPSASMLRMPPLDSFALMTHHGCSAKVNG